MKIYSVFTFLIVVLSYFNIKSGCCGKENTKDITLKLYKFDVTANDIFIKYKNPSDNKIYKEQINKEAFKDNYFYVECDDNNYLNGLILMEYVNTSIDDDKKKSYKIISLENFERCKEKDASGTDWYACIFKQIKFLDYDKDDKYILNQNAEDYFKNIKDSKVSKILTLHETKIFQKDGAVNEEKPIKKEDNSTKSIQIKIEKRLLKDK